MNGIRSTLARLPVATRSGLPGVNGGTPYSTTLTFSKVCTSGSPLRIRRVLSTDSVPTSAAGWLASFDSQVVTTNVGVLASGGASYVTIDGRQGDAKNGIAYGMKWQITADNGTYAIDRTGATTFNNITYTFLEFYGPSCVVTEERVMKNLNVLTGPYVIPAYSGVRKIGLADLKDALAKGVNDFLPFLDFMSDPLYLVSLSILLCDHPDMSH